MACFSPLDAWQLDGGEIVFVERGKVRRALKLPCGQCVGCRLERSRQWAMRCLHEASLYDRNVFITLTYSDEHVPEDWSLRYSDYQKFFKRLRKQYAYFDVRTWSYAPRYYMCGEYGEQFSRPHFHACVFGCDFPDREYFRTNQSGSRLYTSKTLEKLWPYGYSSVGDVTFESAAYVARYVMKKVTGRNADRHYEAVDSDTGEIFYRVPEFNHMSLKPGIGARWFDLYKSDVYPHDSIRVNGMKVRPPKYYDKLLEASDYGMHEGVTLLRARKDFGLEGTPERLRAREAVCKARVNLKKRSIE